MKKICFCLYIFLLFFVSCSYLDYEFKLFEEDYEYMDSSLYLPRPVKNNSSFIGFQVIDSNINDYKIYKKNYGYYGFEVIEDENPIFDSISYDLLKSYALNNKLKLKAVYQEYQDDELFNFKLEKGNLFIKANNFANYPREITIPEYFKNLKVREVSSFGFYGIEELVIVNLPSSIEYLNIYGFANTNIFKINNPSNIEESTFANTLVDKQGKQKYNFEFIEDNYIKTVKVNGLEFEIDIELNGGVLIKEELDLVLSRPIIENKIFTNLENEEGYKIYFEEGETYKGFTLKDYFRRGLGLEYKVNYIDLTDDIYRYQYLKTTDSYALYLLDNNLNLSKVKLPDTYNNKKITEIRDFNNKYVNEIIIGKYVEKIGSLFDTPNLRKLYLPNSLKEISPYAFAGTLLTNVEIPDQVKRIESGVFQFTFIQDFIITKSIDYLSGSSFAMCNEIRFNTLNSNYIVNANKNLVLKDNELVLYAYRNDYQHINLEDVISLGSEVFSYMKIANIINLGNLNNISTKAFYEARIKNRFDHSNIETVADDAFLGVKFEKKQI